MWDHELVRAGCVAAAAGASVPITVDLHAGITSGHTTPTAISASVS